MNMVQAYSRIRNRDLTLPLVLLELLAEWLQERSMLYKPFQKVNLHQMYLGTPKLTPEKRRYLREKRMPYEWTPKYREWLRDQWGNACAYCGRSNCTFHVDHIIPVSWANCPGATVENGVWSCASCNTDRGNRDLAEWHLDTFKDEKKTDNLVRWIWEVQKRAHAEFSPKVRTKMRKDGRKIVERFKPR